MPSTIGNGNQRGEVLTVMAIAFVIFTVFMAAGIGIDRLIHKQPTESELHDQWLKVMRDKLDTFDCPNTGVPAARCFLATDGTIVELN